MSVVTCAAMRQLLPILLLLPVLTSCGGGGTPKDLGCLSDLGAAESAFNDAEKGVKDGTVTDADFADYMKTVKEKLSDLAIVNPDATIKQKADDGAQAAGRVRVAMLGGGTLVPEDVNTLRSDINALDAACIAAGK